MIRIDDLHFEYGEGGFTLCVSNLSVARGERIAIALDPVRARPNLYRDV